MNKMSTIILSSDEIGRAINLYITTVRNVANWENIALKATHDDSGNPSITATITGIVEKA